MSSNFEQSNKNEKRIMMKIECQDKSFLRSITLKCACVSSSPRAAEIERDQASEFCGMLTYDKFDDGPCSGWAGAFPLCEVRSFVQWKETAKNNYAHILTINSDRLSPPWSLNNRPEQEKKQSD